MEQGVDQWRANRVKGGVLDNDIVDIDENYINYNNSNPKLVHKADELAVEDTGMTGNYLTLYSPCNIKQLAVIPLPTCMPNREINTSTQTALLFKTDLPIEAQKAHIFTGLNKSLLSIQKKFIMYAKPYLLIR